MKKIILITLSVGSLLSFAACNKFLDVYPEDKLIYEQIIGSEPAINNVLNGIYMKMAEQTMYGAQLSTTVIECMAQQYDVTTTSDHTFKDHAAYSYGEDNVKSTFSNIWSQMYKQILNINDFIHIVNNATVAIPKERKDILLGEAYALRAFHHFDLLRLYGPVYDAADSTSQCMPYNDMGDGQLRPLLPANEVMNKIEADLRTAETLLANDPVKTQGVNKKRSGDPVADFMLFRNYRMNYFAVKALQARVHLWRGNKPEALAAATTVIGALEANTKLFPWVSAVTATTDRVFFEEVLFGIHSRNMYTFYDNYFAGNATAKNYLCPTSDAKIDAMFPDKGEYRYKNLWQIPTGLSRKALVKYAKPSNLSDTTFAYVQPLIRKAELYYIAAECSDDVQYLNTVRSNRGFTISPLSAVSELEVRDEYRREMFGEGQLFYYYKRLHKVYTSIPSNGPSASVSMTAAKYKVPLPLAEQEIHPK